MELWLACIAWLFVWSFAPSAYQFIAWPIILAVALIGGLAIFDHLLRYAPLHAALRAQGLKWTPGTGDQSLGALQLGSAALALQAILAGVETYAFVPLFLSGMLPQMLKVRKDEEALLQSLQPAG